MAVIVSRIPSSSSTTRSVLRRSDMQSASILRDWVEDLLGWLPWQPRHLGRCPSRGGSRRCRRDYDVAVDRLGTVAAHGDRVLGPDTARGEAARRVVPDV